MKLPSNSGRGREHGRQTGRRARIRQVVLKRAWPLAIACMAISAGCFGARSNPEPEVVPAEPVRLVPNLDSLSNVLAIAADSLPPNELPSLEMRIREWLGRLEFEDPALLPEGETPRRYFRLYRGRLLDALGWAAFRHQDLRQAEAALVSAVAEINSRGTSPRRGRSRHAAARDGLPAPPWLAAWARRSTRERACPDRRRTSAAAGGRAAARATAPLRLSTTHRSATRYRHVDRAPTRPRAVGCGV